MEIFNNVHLVGAGGIGLSSVGKFLVHRGKRVTGSDARHNEATAELERLGAVIRAGHTADNLPPDTDLLIYSDAVPPGNPERSAAKERGVLQMSYFDFLGRFSSGRPTVGVSGTNGKSTTTAMLGTLLVGAGLDPTVIVGSKLKSFADGNLRVGSELTVIEACEYRANMLKLSPETIVLTDVKPDHLDYYGDFEQIKKTFQQYLNGLPSDGLLVWNADDPASSELDHPARAVSYGIDSAADYRAADIRVEPGRQVFQLLKSGEPLAEITLRVPGRFNVYNALAALAAAHEYGADVESLKRSMGEFTGIWRRFEVVGQRGGAPVISDYAHHPDAVRGTIQAARDFYPDRRVVVCFQPHHRNRTERLFDGFVEALAAADVPLVTDIYEVAGREREETGGVRGQDLARAVAEYRGFEEAEVFAGSPEAARGKLKQVIEIDDVVIIMGAGDIYRIAEDLVDGT